jgi:ornithine cyclodeaminase
MIWWRVAGASPGRAASRDEVLLQVTILREAEIRRSVAMGEPEIDAVARAFGRLAEGRVSLPPVVRVDVPASRGEVDIKTAYVEGLDRFAIKVASGFFDNPALGLPYGSGAMLVMSAKTGLLEALLLDNGYLTDLRTGIAGAIAARHLAPARVETAGVIGAGVQARWQMRGLRAVREFRSILVRSTRREAERRYADEMGRALGVPVLPAESVEQVVRESQVVVTTTPSREPYLRAEWLHPGLHVTAVGADGEHKQELFAEALGRADRLVCDSRRQCFALGELHHALEAGVLGRDADVAELGELCNGTRGGRASESEISVCDLTGVGVQDTAIAVLCLERAQALGLGTRFEV